MKILDRPLLHLAAIAVILRTLAALTPAFGQTAAAPAEFHAPAEEKPKEAPKTNWVTSASLGFSLTRGNSQTLLLTANVLSEKKWSQNELRLGADVAYGTQNEEETADTIHGFAQYNRLITDRFYAYARADALHDGIADIAYRVTLSPGVGYYFVKTAKTTFSGEIGPGVVIEREGNVDSTYATLRIAERAEHHLNDHVRLWESIEYLPQVDRWGNYIVNGEIGVDTALSKKSSLKVFAVDSYNNEPAAGKLKNDFKFVTAIGYKF
jgi:putative salt-induced outer membrane protein